MSQQLIYTSSPSGLRPGSRGFATVAVSRGMAPSLVGRLESLSGYTFAFGPSDDSARRNPVRFAHMRLRVGEHHFTVLSRVAPAGVDYSGRSNVLAHHVVLDANDRSPAGPAWLLCQPGFLCENWSGRPRYFDESLAVPRGEPAPSRCAEWEQLTGDAGWGGVPIASLQATPRRPIYVIYPPGTDALALLAESLLLLPPAQRWTVHFSSYFADVGPDVQCQWRCVPAGSRGAQVLPKSGALVLDLTRALGVPPTGPFVDAARAGVIAEPMNVGAPQAAPPRSPENVAIGATPSPDPESLRTYALDDGAVPPSLPPKLPRQQRAAGDPGPMPRQYKLTLALLGVVTTAMILCAVQWWRSEFSTAATTARPTDMEQEPSRPTLPTTNPHPETPKPVTPSSAPAPAPGNQPDNRPGESAEAGLDEVDKPSYPTPDPSEPHDAEEEAWQTEGTKATQPGATSQGTSASTGSVTPKPEDGPLGSSLTPEPSDSAAHSPLQAFTVREPRPQHHAPATSEWRIVELVRGKPVKVGPLSDNAPYVRIAPRIAATNFAHAFDRITLLTAASPMRIKKDKKGSIRFQHDHDHFYATLNLDDDVDLQAVREWRFQLWFDHDGTLYVLHVPHKVHEQHIGICPNTGAFALERVRSRPVVFAPGGAKVDTNVESARRMRVKCGRAEFVIRQGKEEPEWEFTVGKTADVPDITGETINRTIALYKIVPAELSRLRSDVDRLEKQCDDASESEKARIEIELGHKRDRLDEEQGKRANRYAALKKEIKKWNDHWRNVAEALESVGHFTLKDEYGIVIQTLSIDLDFEILEPPKP